MSHPAVAPWLLHHPRETPPDPNPLSPSWQDLASHGKSPGASRSWDFLVSAQNTLVFVQPPSTTSCLTAISLPAKDKSLRKRLYGVRADAAVRASAPRKPPGRAGTGRSSWSPHGMCHPSTPPSSQVPCPRPSQAHDPVLMLPTGVYLPLGRVLIVAASALPRHGSLGGGSISSPSTEMKNSSTGLLLLLV